MRSKLSWIKSFICPVIDKHPEENGISGKRKGAALYRVCMHVPWLPEKIHKSQASMVLSPSISHTVYPLTFIDTGQHRLVFVSHFFPHGDKPDKPVVFLRGLQCLKGEILCADGQKIWVVWAGEGLLPFSAAELGEKYKITGIFQGLFPLRFVLFTKGDREPQGS